VTGRRKTSDIAVKMAFEEAGVRIAVADIQPLKLVAPALRKSSKYIQIATSIREVGIIEPPVVARDRASRGKYLLLDGHLRIDILKEMGKTEVDCLISTDDEAYTYNKRVNRLAIIQEHRMILKAIERGASDERIAKALNIDVKTLQTKKQLLVGICPEAIDLLKDKQVTIKAFAALKKMVPLRQIEAAELMIAMNKYTVSYADSLLAATPQSQLADPGKPKAPKGLSNEQLALMERESVNLEREFKMAEQSYGTDHLDLVLAKGYLTKLLGNARVVRYLAQYHQELLAEFQRIAELERAAA
jgi:ParB-like chromosome segregation protein Spo0J